MRSHPAAVIRQTAAAAGLHLWPQLQLLYCWHQQWLPLQIAIAAIALHSHVGVAYTGVCLLYSAALLQRPAFAMSDMSCEAHEEAHEHQCPLAAPQQSMGIGD